jgi:hypothetical protein
VNTHICPLRALAAPRIGDLPQQRNHAQLLEQRGVERNFVQPVENFARRSRRAGPFDGIDGDEKRILRLAFADERRDRGIAGIASIPIGLALNFNGLEQGRQTRRRQKNVGRNLGVAKNAPASGPDIGGRDKQFDLSARDLREID